MFPDGSKAKHLHIVLAQLIQVRAGGEGNPRLSNTMGKQRESMRRWLSVQSLPDTDSHGKGPAEAY